MIFIDTGAFIAKYISNDQHHDAAERTWRRIARESLATSNHVIDETLTLLMRRTDARFALEKGRIILSSQLFKISGPMRPTSSGP